MNYLLFFVVSMIAYSAISNAESTTAKSVSSTTSAPKTSSSTSKATSKTTTAAAETTTKATKTTTAHSKAKTTISTTSKTHPSKAKTTVKPSKPAHHHSHRKSESHNSQVMIDFDNFITNETIVKQYTNCFLDRGPCHMDSAKEIKDIIAKSIKHKCAVCNELQYSHAKRYLQHLELHHPDDYNSFVKKYDPDNHIQHFLQAAPSKPKMKEDLKASDNHLFF